MLRETTIWLLITVVSAGDDSKSTSGDATCLQNRKPTEKHDLGAPCDFFNHNGQATCCSKSSNREIRRTFAAFEFNFDKCLSCQHNWAAVLCNANCDSQQAKFIQQKGIGASTNFTLKLDPHLCTKLWYSCTDEDTDEFESLFGFSYRGSGKSRAIRYIFQGLDSSAFAVLKKDGYANLTALDESIFADSASLAASKAKGFGSAFLPRDISESLMPEGAEEFCVAMGSDKHTLGLTISMCTDDEGLLCKAFPLNVEIGLENCEDCLKVEKLQHNDDHFHGYEFCFTEANNHEHLAETAKSSLQFGTFLFLGGTGANIVFQSNRNKVKWCQWFSESLFYLFAGVMLGGVAYANGAADPDNLQFDAKTFMFILLPPIMLREGFCINQRLFFANLNTILLLAFLGTFITVFSIAMMIIWLQDLVRGSYAFPDLTTNEAFLFATIISAVDPVAVVSQFAALRVDPSVEILVVGESLVNDAVIIVLFKIWKEAVMHEQSAQDFDFSAIAVSFCSYCIMSVLTGLFVGVMSSLYFKYQNFAGNEGLEMVLFLIMGYVSFLLAEIFHFSGILSTLVCGGFMAAYTERNLSDHNEGGGDDSSGVKGLINMFAAFADEIVFIMTGMAAVVYYESFFFFFSFMIMLMCLVARALAVFPLVFVSHYFRREAITKNQACMLWWAGLRGAVAVALAVDIPSRHRHALTACTCFVVFFTVAVQGGGSTHMLKLLKIRVGVNEHEYSREYSKRFREGASTCSKQYRKTCQALDTGLLEPILIRTQEEKDARSAGKGAAHGLKRPASMSDMSTVAKLQNLERQVAELKHKNKQLRTLNAEISSKTQTTSKVLTNIACCIFSEEVSVGLFKLSSLLMAVMSAALAYYAGIALDSDWGQVHPVRSYAQAALVVGVAICVLSLCGCAATMVRATALRGMMLTVYCIFLSVTLLANVCASLTLLDYGASLEYARQLEFDPSKYSESSAAAQDNVMRDTVAMYAQYQCRFGNTTLSKDPYDYVYKSMAGEALSARDADIAFVQLNLSCAEPGGKWYQNFVSEQCVFAGDAAQYTRDQSACALPYISYIARQEDRASAAEGMEVYCACRVSLSKMISESAHLVGGLALALAIVQLAMLVGCVRLCLRGGKKRDDVSRSDDDPKQSDQKDSDPKQKGPSVEGAAEWVAQVEAQGGIQPETSPLTAPIRRVNKITVQKSQARTVV
jgi:sodium/hydrogen exchanger 3